MEEKEERRFSFPMRNKKGSVTDVFIIGAAIFILAITILLGSYLYNRVATEMLPHINSSTAATNAINAMTNTLPTFDYFFLAVFIGLVLAMIISGFMIETHPVFTFVFFIMMVLATIVAVPISNSYEAFANDPIFASTAANFAITNLILTKLPLITLVIGILMIIVIYGKSQFEGGGRI